MFFLNCLTLKCCYTFTVCLMLSNEQVLKNMEAQTQIKIIGENFCIYC